MSEATAYGVRGSARVLDLGDDAACAATVAEVVADFGGLHTLVHAAGPHVPMEHLSTVAPAGWRRSSTPTPRRSSGSSLRRCPRCGSRPVRWSR